MQSVAKFVTKAYPVSGCFDYLSEVRTERERSVRVCVCAHTHVHTCFSRNSDPALESDVNQESSVYVCVCVCVHACVCTGVSIPVFQGTLIMHWSQKCDRLPLECLDAQAPLEAK